MENQNQTQIIPLSITDFPGVLASSTVMEDGNSYLIFAAAQDTTWTKQ